MTVAVAGFPWVAIAADAQNGDAEPDVRMVQKVIVLVAATTLLLVLGIMILAIIRFSRNWRERIVGRDSKPTPTSDVWSQHRLPDDVESMLTDDDTVSDADFDADGNDDDEPDGGKT